MSMNVIRSVHAFNAVESELFHAVRTGDVCERPWTFSVNIDGVDYYPIAFERGEERRSSYATEGEATRAALDFKLPEDVAFVVLKNADFTEGRGPMLLDRLYRSYAAAHAYVMEQRGIFGSQQGRHVSFGVNIYGGLYCVDHYNGYSIELSALY